jgi:hypothetical protein
MGSKASNFYQSNRPESGGADRDELREKSGLLERDKQEFAASEKVKDEMAPGGAAEPGPDRVTGDESEQR